ncbi:hypothetical protein BUZ94_13050 [Mammaliicoccus sciuri]|uniref:hypothetical protein n=1 Tax=Mammaliicoccus sciuri TaxID=1296 RepID=UPI000E6A376A|nr:hypothetical protein [Mammaliicoccus sciuri]RIO07385.1 hypothetical protein BUZ94_13050 [Mammaliicoccus sciuri]
MFEEKVDIMRVEDGECLFYADNRIEETLNPKMITNFEIGYIIVLNTEENIKKFDNLIEWSKDILYDEQNPYIKCKVFYNDIDDYYKIWEGIYLRAEIQAERNKQELLDNPPIGEDIKKISNLEELVYYLIEERNRYKSIIYYEDGYDEIEEATIKAECDELLKLAKMHLEGE